MSPELLSAVKERISLGYSKGAIQSELQAAGYDPAIIEQVYAAAQHKPPKPAGAAPIPSPQDTATGDAAPLPSDTPTSLPGVMSLFKTGWQFVFDRIDLLGFLMIPFVIGSLSQSFFVNAMLTGSGAAGILSSFLVLILISIALGIYNFLNTGAVLFTVSQLFTRRVAYGEAFAWARTNFWSLVWIYILTLCVIYGGFLFLIIPGLIVSIMVMFSQFVLASEGVRGMSALLRSRALVKGKGWAVFFRVFLLGLLLFVVLIPVSILISVLSPSVADTMMGDAGSIQAFVLLSGILNSVLSAALLLFGMRVGAEFYRVLAADRPQTPPAADAWKYKTLAWFGLTFPLLVFFVSIILASLSSARDMGREATLMQNLNNLRSQAEIQYNEQGFTYEGVCDRIPSTFSYGEVVVCNDSEDGWAALIESDDGKLFCVDEMSSPASGALAPGSTECAFDADAKSRAAELRGS